MLFLGGHQNGMLNEESRIRRDIRYPASLDIGYPAFRLARYPKKLEPTVSGALCILKIIAKKNAWLI
jgi:hypothetical protein